MMVNETEQLRLEMANEEVKKIIVNNKTTAKRLARIEVVWNNYCRDLILSTPKEKLKDVKIPCFKCMRCIFKTLTSEPKIEDYCFGNYKGTNDVCRTSTKHGKNLKVLTEVEYFFKCKICEGGSAFSFEED